MGFGSNLLSGLLSTLFGDDIFSDEKNNADAQFGKRNPGSNYKSNFYRDPLDDVPIGTYTQEEKRKANQPKGYANSKNKTSNNSSNYSKTSSNTNNYSQNKYNSQNNYSSSNNTNNYSTNNQSYNSQKGYSSDSYSNKTKTNQTNYSSNSSNYTDNNNQNYSYQNNTKQNDKENVRFYDFNDFKYYNDYYDAKEKCYTTDWDNNSDDSEKYYSTDRDTSSNEYSSKTRNTWNNYSDDSEKYYNTDRTTSSAEYNKKTKNTWDNYTNDKIKKDQSSSASQGFRRQHATKSKDGIYTYPTLSTKGVKTVKNDKATFIFGEPHFSTYHHGVRGIAFPYYLKIKEPHNRKILVSAKFCNSSGHWIKSLVPEMSDRYGDLIVNESVVCMDYSFEVDSYLFIPFGVLAVKNTQKVYLNVDVFVDGTGPQHLIRYVHGFDYFVYENDPREPESSSDFTDTQVGFDELIGLVAHVIKADGVCAPEEIRAVISFFKNFRGIDKDKLKDKLKFKLSNPSDIDKDCEVIKNNYNTQTRLSFLSLLFKIAVSDDSVPEVELNLIEKISGKMGILTSSFTSLKAEYLPATDRVWHLFGLTPNATKEQVKRAYRKKCKECHPDRFANASKEEYKKAEERFKELQDFYGFLMRKFE